MELIFHSSKLCMKKCAKFVIFILTLSRTEIYLGCIHEGDSKSLFNKLLPVTGYNLILDGFIIVCLGKTIMDDGEQVSSLVHILWVGGKEFKLFFFSNFTGSLTYTQ